jgi:hypothetical protein
MIGDDDDNGGGGNGGGGGADAADIADDDVAIRKNLFPEEKEPWRTKLMQNVLPKLLPVIMVALAVTSIAVITSLAVTGARDRYQPSWSAVRASDPLLGRGTKGIIV